ncbi:uncharacterized protein CXorf49-like [Microcebus murinus]|uniref:uncharacterized protein CXorf49-like n=1 Tax=Microcebus murinus TaxID=30608 RepID=UPI003F6B5004
MSSPDEVSVCGAAFGLEGGEQANVHPAVPGAPRGPIVGLDVGTPRSGEGEGGLADPESFEAEQEVIEAGGAVISDQEGQLSTPTVKKGNDVDFESRQADKSVPIMQPLSDWAIRGFRRHSCTERRNAQVSTLWPDLESGHSVRGTFTTYATPPPVIVPRKVWARGNRKRGAKSKLRMGCRAFQQPSMEGLVELPSDPESPDEFSEIPMRLPTPRPGPPCLHMHRGGFGSDYPHIRAIQVPGNSQAWALSQRGVTPRGPAPSSDQEPPVHDPRRERQQQPPGSQGCVRCAKLQREMDGPLVQPAAMKCHGDKFQAL